MPPCAISLAAERAVVGLQGLQWKRVQSTSLQWLCGKQADIHGREWACCKYQAKSKAVGNRYNPKNCRWEGEEVYRYVVTVKRKNGDVNGQCHSRNRTKYIYINSLL